MPAIWYLFDFVPFTPPPRNILSISHFWRFAGFGCVGTLKLLGLFWFYLF